MRGVSLKQYRETFGVDLFAEHSSELQRFQAAGLVELNEDLLKLTRVGALLSNEVFAAFV